MRRHGEGIGRSVDDARAHPGAQPLNLAGGLRVFACPAQWFISDTFGSEATWPLRLMQEGHRQFGNEYLAVCNGYEVKGPTPGIAFEAEGRSPGEWTVGGMALLIARYFVGGRRFLASGRFDVFHHMFPWGFRVGFNPLAVLGHTDGIPFVVGPIEAPQVYLDYTEYQHRAVLDANQAKVQRGVEVGSARALRLLVSPLQLKSLVAADALVFDGESTRELYRSSYPAIADTPTYIIPAGVETDAFFPRIAFRDRPREIMTAGYFTKRKGLEILIAAMPSILRELPDFILRVCGDGPALSDAQRLASSLGIQEHVVFQGLVPRSELPHFYSHARLYVQPSLSEAYPSAVLEALACGTPVVTTRVGVLPDHFAHDAAVGFASAPNPPMIATAVIQSLSEDGVQRSQAARTTAETRLSWKRAAAEWQGVYRNALG